MARKIKAQALAVTTDGDDFLIGSRNDDEIHGGDGNDYIQGGYGSDTLLGEGGNDTLWGYNQWGVSDVLIGGAGSDTFYFDHPGESLLFWSGTPNPTQDVIPDFESGVDAIQLGGYIADGGVTLADITINDHGDGTWDVLVNMPNDDSNAGVDYLTMQILGGGDVPVLGDILIA